MVGITSIGVYVPAYRLTRDGISRAWKTKSLGGERTVAKHDEDSPTMAVGAALDCMKHSPRQVRNPRLGLTHNLGGNIRGGVACVSITGNEIERK
jgi:hypothetical protein